MIDRPKMDQMLHNLQTYLNTLQGLARTSRDAFLANPDRIGNAKYHCVILIECCIDIANHVIATQDFRFPKDNADSFAVLGENRILDAAMVPSLGAMARFRNRLVHLYWEIDNERIYAYLQDSLKDVEAFHRSIVSFLSTSP